MLASYSSVKMTRLLGMANNVILIFGLIHIVDVAVMVTFAMMVNYLVSVSVTTLVTPVTVTVARRAK